MLPSPTGLLGLTSAGGKRGPARFEMSPQHGSEPEPHRQPEKFTLKISQGRIFPGDQSHQRAAGRLQPIPAAPTHRRRSSPPRDGLHSCPPPPWPALLTPRISFPPIL